MEAYPAQTIDQWRLMFVALCTFCRVRKDTLVLSTWYKYLPSIWYKFLVPMCLVTSTWSQVLDTRYLVPATWSQVFGTKDLVPNAWYQTVCTKYLVPHTWYKVSDTKYLAPSLWYQVLDTKYLVPDTWYKILTKCDSKWRKMTNSIAGNEPNGLMCLHYADYVHLAYHSVFL